VLVVSLIVLIVQLPDKCESYEPVWVLGVSTFTFTFAFIWLAVLFFEGRHTDRPMAMVYGVCCNFAVGFAGWGISEWFLGSGTADREAMHNSFYWIPFWILGALLGTDFYNLRCT
jgi:hypothetical protein